MQLKLQEWKVRNYSGSVTSSITAQSNKLIIFYLFIYFKNTLSYKSFLKSFLIDFNQTASTHFSKSFNKRLDQTTKAT